MKKSSKILDGNNSKEILNIRGIILKSDGF